MELALLVWFASVVGGISHMLGSVAFILIAGTILSLPIVFRREMKLPKWVIPSILAVVSIFSVTSVLLPSEKTVYMMLGAYTGQKIIQSETAGKVLEIVNLKIDDYLEEAKKEKAK